MTQEIRWDVIHLVEEEARYRAKGENRNEKYNEWVEFIDATTKLTLQEKAESIRQITWKKDLYNMRKKSDKYTCSSCGKEGYTVGSCEHCLREWLEHEFSNWTSGNEEIDKEIQISQINNPIPGFLIEWILFENLSNVKFEAEGGSAVVYTGIWDKGEIIAFKNCEKKFERGPPLPVVIKQLTHSDNPKFIKELSMHVKLHGDSYGVVHCYGVSKDSNGNWLLVLKRMKYDLRRYISENWHTITWKEIYKLLYFIMGGILTIHTDNIIHKDLHSGNILCSNEKWRIADLGLSSIVSDQLGSIYGNLPYIAPEVLRGKVYTKAADIYSIGMIMYECCAGKPPFHGDEHDLKLMIKICYGSRPVIPLGIPEMYKKMICRCWDNDPNLRPTAVELNQYFKREYLAGFENEYQNSLLFVNTNETIESKIRYKKSAVYYSLSQSIIKVSTEAEFIDDSIDAQSSMRVPSQIIEKYDGKENCTATNEKRVRKLKSPRLKTICSLIKNLLFCFVRCD